ncbi:MAG: alpha/beta hydrolase [Clostridiales bacterium]|nr:alpha/beta hydrolase [Clostridiales bacterium]
MLKILGKILKVIIGLASMVVIFAYRNLKYDYINENFMEKTGEKLGFTEKQVVLDDGSVLNYGEGPANGQPLLLLHGQQTTWQDYAKVLPALSKEFHIFAVDYYGHGKSSKDAAKYKANIIGQDLVWFMEHVIKKPSYVSGHSSGALLAAWLAANNSENVIGLVLEDGPFFSTEPGRAENTFAYKGFESMHNFLNQKEIDNYTHYSLLYDPMIEIINKHGEDTWEKAIKGPALKYMENHPGEIPRLWFYPPELGVNAIFELTRNIQDGTGNYDLYFGESFYDFSWFEGFNQEETLKNIKAPSLIMQVNPSKKTAPDYCDENGILLSAMDREDARRVCSLIPNSRYITGFDSMHDIHADCPRKFTKAVLKFKEQVETGTFVSDK